MIDAIYRILQVGAIIAGWYFVGTFLGFMGDHWLPGMRPPLMGVLFVGAAFIVGTWIILQD